MAEWRENDAEWYEELMVHCPGPRRCAPRRGAAAHPGAHYASSSRWWMCGGNERPGGIVSAARKAYTPPVSASPTLMAGSSRRLCWPDPSGQRHRTVPHLRFFNSQRRYLNRPARPSSRL
jgi:hypothetical protein